MTGKDMTIEEAEEEVFTFEAEEPVKPMDLTKPSSLKESTSTQAESLSAS